MRRRADPVLTGLQRAWLASLTPAALRFWAAQRAPERAQAKRLRAILRANRSSAYGRAHRFDEIDSVEAFRRRVPVATHDRLAPFIERVAAGEAGVLTTERVRLMERSGGSTGTATKLIPYTASSLAELGQATGPWLFDLHRRWPRLVGTRAYWSLSPVAQGPRRTAGGVPIGMEDDTEYFGPLRRFVLARTMAVDPLVARERDLSEWRRATLAGLLSAEDLGLISVWSPTFLTLLMEGLEAELDLLLPRLPLSRARAVERAMRRPEGCGQRLWPRLTVISCWSDGPSSGFIAPLRRWFPAVAIQPKGLLATEGVVSVPVGEGPGAALALSAHFLEFLDLDRPDAPTRLPHQLRVGGRYSPILTTGAGLYRYHLMDVLECTAPLRVRFLEKLDRVADLAGEKIHVGQVEAALREGGEQLGVKLPFALLAPVRGGERASPSYCLYLEGDASDAVFAELARHLEACLLEGHAYRYCRELGQLGPLRVQRVRDGRASYLRTLVAHGQRAGDIKPSLLDGRAIWAEVFGAGEPVRDR